MSSIDNLRQDASDSATPWHDLSAQQLKQAGLNISEIQQRKLDKSLTRLSAALKTAGFDWMQDNTPEDTAASLRCKKTLETYLATYQ